MRIAFGFDFDLFDYLRYDFNSVSKAAYESKYIFIIKMFLLKRTNPFLEISVLYSLTGSKALVIIITDSFRATPWSVTKSYVTQVHFLFSKSSHCSSLGPHYLFVRILKLCLTGLLAPRLWLSTTLQQNSVPVAHRTVFINPWHPGSYLQSRCDFSQHLLFWFFFLSTVW